MAARPNHVKVGLGHSNVVVTACLLIFLCGLVGSFGYAAWTGTGPARFVWVGLATAFAIPLVMLLRTLPTFLGRRYVVIDASGIHLLHGSQTVSLPWTEVMAVGLGYEQAPVENKGLPLSMDAIQDRVKDYAVDKASEALQVSQRRRIALEILTPDPSAVGRYPKLKPYWKHRPPPWAGLPPTQWRFPLPPVVAIAQQVEWGMQTFAWPGRWLGWYPRPWSG